MLYCVPHLKSITPTLDAGSRLPLLKKGTMSLVRRIVLPRITQEDSRRLKKKIRRHHLKNTFHGYECNSEHICSSSYTVSIAVIVPRDA